MFYWINCVSRYCLNSYRYILKSGKVVEENIYGTGIDIHSKSPFPSNVLSNFHKSRFSLDGIRINSLEGFLQSLKTDDVKKQKKICKLVGAEAKKAGGRLARKTFDGESLFWLGKMINRDSQEYKNLLTRAYEARYKNDKLFRKALKVSEGKKLTHSIGKSDPADTILTENEFINCLLRLREKS